ncbi:guanylate kinase [bacterium]|jgi:guanylate kinase|nr:guanylate kinase [bacterium]
MIKTPGSIVIISGPSGVGKGTLINALLDCRPNLRIAVSATTRKPRENEVHGENYYFMSNTEFDHAIIEDDFLEWCQVHTNCYGSLKSQILPLLQNGNNVLLEIDIQGAEKLRQQNYKLVTIFIAPPSLEILSERLHKRDTEATEVIQKRLATAKQEMAATEKYDHVVVNDDLKKAIEEISNILDNLEE